MTSTTTWSTQQEQIFNWFAAEQSGSALVVRARAGCGKTTTIMEGVRRAPERDVLVAAFSKDIATELQARLNASHRDGAVAKTLHAVGYACVRAFRDRIKVAFTADRADALATQACGRQAPDAIIRLVSKLHTKGREIAPHATQLGDLATVQVQFDCLPDEQWENAGYTAEWIEAKALQAMELAANVNAGDTIDGSDMIFLPVRNSWLTPQYDMVVVDEAQDMTVAQLEVARGVLRKGGRMAVVGDDRQAIFGFRGADSESLDRLKAELGATELNLTVTYRCGRSIVERAQSLVPDFTAGEANPDGTVDNIVATDLPKAAKPGDFVLSRTNAPLVSLAMQLLRNGTRARVAGRDIGKGIVTLVRKLKGKSVPDLLIKIERNAAKEESRLRVQMTAASTKGRLAALEAKVEAVRDQADMLLALCDDARSIAEVEQRIEALFTDDGLGAAGFVTCSTVHRAKGLEAPRVFVLTQTLRGGSVEEDNIAYVAITRAKQHLTMVAAASGE